MEAAACIHQSSALKTSSHVTLSRQVCLLDMQAQHTLIGPAKYGRHTMHCPNTASTDGLSDTYLAAAPAQNYLHKPRLRHRQPHAPPICKDHSPY